MVDYKQFCKDCGSIAPVEVAVVDKSKQVVRGAAHCACGAMYEVEIPLNPESTSGTRTKVGAACLTCKAPLGRRTGAWKMYCRQCAFEAKREQLIIELMDAFSKGYADMLNDRDNIRTKLLALSRIL